MTFAQDQSTAERGPHQEHSQDGSSIQETLPSTTRSSLKTYEEDDVEFTRWHFGENCTYPDDPSESRNEKSRPAKGLPELLAKLQRHTNLHIVRAFRPARWRLLHHLGSRKALLWDRVLLLDKKGGEHLRGLTRNQMRPAGQPPNIDDDYEVHMQEIEELSGRIHTVQCALESTERLYPVHRSVFRDLFDWMVGNKIYDQTRDESSGYVYWDAPLDTCQLRRQESSWVIELSSRVVTSRIFQWLKPSHSRPDFVPSNILNFVLRALFVISAAFLLLLPAGILYLADLTRQQEFGVICGCTIIFLNVAAATKISLRRILVAGIAYAAFLATVNEVTRGYQG